MHFSAHIFGVSIKTFGVMFALAFLSAGVLIGRRLKAQPRPLWLTTAIATIAAALLVSLISGCGSSGSAGKTTGGSSGRAKAAKYAGTAAKPLKPAPPLALEDSLGRRVNLKQYRGKAVLVTFIYTHCPDTCPLIVSHLRVAQQELGAKAKRLQIIAVSTDPRGDNPKTVGAFLHKHLMTGRMQYLIGSRKQLQPVWKDWFILAKAAPGPKDRVGHSALVYGISASGKITTIYPGNFVPTQIVHDVPLLASE